MQKDTFIFLGVIDPGATITVTDADHVYVYAGDQVDWSPVPTGKTLDDSTKEPVVIVARRLTSIPSFPGFDALDLIRTDPWPIPPPPPPPAGTGADRPRLRAALEAAWPPTIGSSFTKARTFVATPIAKIVVDQAHTIVWQLVTATGEWVRVADGTQTLADPLLVIQRSPPALGGMKDVELVFDGEDPWPIPPPPPPRLQNVPHTNKDIAKDFIDRGKERWRNWF